MIAGVPLFKHRSAHCWPAWLLVACMLGIAVEAGAQRLPQGYFISPIIDEIGLSATFAEFRTNHFHAGIDIRTGGAVGKPVRAVADGYVARVSISPWGGGKILYIKHPNGYTSVYMHLSAYAGAIGRAVAEEQRATQSYAISKTFFPHELPVKKGQVVALSGNSGSSGGPHLHFELRRGGEADLYTHATTYNPLLFGLPYRDGLKPTIRGLRIYPIGGKAVEVGKENTVSVSTPFYLGIYATDAAEGSTPRNGIDRVEVYLDGTLAFRYTTEAFPMDSSRMVNALIDYRHFCSTRQPYLLTRLLPGARGPWVPVCLADGVFRLEPGSTHTIGVRVMDIMDNVAERVITVKATTPSSITTPPRHAEDTTGLVTVAYNRPWQLARAGFRLMLPAHTLYADDRLRVEENSEKPYLSAVVSVEPTINDIPPNIGYSLSLKPNGGVNLPEEKLTVVRISGKRHVACATSHAGGWHTATLRDFGHFALLADTVPPHVAAVNFSAAKPLRVSILKVRLGDNLSGLASFKFYLNGQWILAEYDGKTAIATINCGRLLKAGRNKLTADVEDACGNRTHKEWLLAR